VFVEATSKSGLQTVLTLGPVLVDSTPPRFLLTPEVKVVQGQLEVVVDGGQVVDPEQPSGVVLVFTYRLGEWLRYCSLIDWVSGLDTVRL
jgi:hypothetical protein